MEISGAQPLSAVTQQPPTSTPSISQVVVQGAPLMPHSRAMGFSQGKTVQLATPMIAAYSSKDHEQQQANTEPTNVSELVSTFSRLFKQEVSTIQVHNFEQELQRLASEFDASRTQLDAEAFCSRSDNNLGIASDTDLKAYNESGESIIKLITLRHEQQQEFMMTPSTVTNSIVGSSCYERALELATVGAIIEPDPSFVHLTPEQTHRRIITDIPQTIAFHALKFWRSQRAIILPLSTLSEADRTLLSFVSLHLQFKPEASQGRLCIDPSNTEDKSIMPLNTPYTKEAAIMRYGPVVFPTINSIITEWHFYNIKHGVTWDQCYIEKDDIVEAFPQVRMEALSACLMAIMISALHVWIPINGTFGWSGLPFAYNVFGLGTMDILLPMMWAVLHRYCDDYVNYGIKSHLEHDRSLIVKLIEALFKEQALDERKHEPPTQYTHVIGWMIDLKHGTITLKERAWKKLRHTFFNLISKSIRTPQKYWEAAASLAERFSQALPGMRCFVTPLHKQSAKAGGNRCATKATLHTNFAIDMWRLALLSQWIVPEAFIMPLETFAKIDVGVHYDLISDASTPIVAAGIYHPETRQLLAWTSVHLPIEYTTTRQATLYQNQREYIGYLVSLLLLTMYLANNDNDRKRQTPVRWFSDNITAESWAAHAKARSLHSLPANIAITLMQLKCNIHLQDTIHVPSIHMNDIDGATRNQSTPSLTKEKFIDFDNNKSIIDMISLCDPTKQESYQYYKHMLFQFQVLIDRINEATQEHCK